MRYVEGLHGETARHSRISALAARSFTNNAGEVNPRYPIAAHIFCAFSPVNVMSSCVLELRSK